MAALAATIRRIESTSCCGMKHPTKRKKLFNFLMEEGSMKKLFQIGAILCGILFAQTGYAAQNAPAYGDQCCPEEQQCCPQDQACGDCWCLMCHYEPCYYNQWRCVEDQQYCTKKCCRMVPKYYDVQRCKYVPQYYTETCCKYEPEYYDVQECKPCKRWVCDKKCRYVPKYYYKKVCMENRCETPCATDNQCCDAR